MSSSDPIADMLTIIRNGLMARHEFVLVPVSKLKLSIAGILKEEGFISDWEVIEGRRRMIKVCLRYDDNKRPVLSGLRRVSKPSLRVYCSRSKIPRIYGGLGVAILSTSKGVMTDQQARRSGVGGEVLCYLW